jgi:Adenosine-deaminase (editase) domain.
MSFDRRRRHDGSHLQTHRDDISTVIARTSLDHYNNILPNKGKPTPNKEWTVYAAIVATTTFIKGVDTSNQGDCKVSNDQSKGEEIRAWVVSSATGSKCTAINSCTLQLPMQLCNCKNSSTMSAGDDEDGNDQSKGMILHDSHAEVLARRGLLKVLWREIYMDLLKESQGSSEENTTIQSNEDKNPTLLLQRVSNSSSTKNNGDDGSENVISYQLNEKIQLHMYISDSPCGDASIYDIVPEYKTDQASATTTTTKITFTGAKIILPQKPCTTARDERLDNFRPCDVDQDKVHIARETVQVVSALRLKSGRSNLPAHLRSMSMSCSDKLCKWMVLGLQGSGLLSNFVQKPIILSTVVVSHDVKACIKSQEEALHRAVVERATRTIEVASSKFSKDNNRWVTVPCYPLKVQVFVCHDIIFPQSKAAADAKAIEHGLKTKSKSIIVPCHKMNFQRNESMV